MTQEVPALRVLIVDDEPLAIERLEMLIARMPNVTVVGQARKGSAAIALAADLLPDLCLLDIAMPDMTGIDVARAFSKMPRPPMVVFVTAYDRFAVTAFDIEAVDFLVKPVEPERLLRAMDRARRFLAEPPAKREYLDEFWVHEHQGLRRIEASEINRITAERDYMRLHAGARTWLVNDSLTRLEKELSPKTFIRLHRSAIVNRSFIVGMRHDETGWTARLRDSSEQKIGRAYAANARALRSSASGAKSGDMFEA